MIGGGAALMGADEHLVKGTVIAVAAMITALVNRTLDTGIELFHSELLLKS